MLCPNCGAGLDGRRCSYCGSITGSRDEEATKLRDIELRRDEIARKIAYLKESGAPVTVLQKKIRRLQEQLDDIL